MTENLWSDGRAFSEKYKRHFRSDGRKYRPVTNDDDRRIEELRIAGLSHRAIGAAIGREKSIIAFRLKTLALRDDGL